MLETPRKINPMDHIYVPETLSIRIIYYVGYSVTTVVLIIALAIFLHHKSLRCLRNSIHCNLFLAFILSNITWLITNNTIKLLYGHAPEWVCKFFVAATTYFHTVTFYWMFVEGLYLFTIVVWAFSAQKLRLWYYMIVAWATPFLVTIIWAIVKENLDNMECWLHTTGPVDYIIHAPVLFLLASNVLFMITIIWVLVTKMKASNSLESRQTRKAVKATVVLVPLLGLTYVMFLRSPFDDEVADNVFKNINAVFQSSQGLFVAIFYCFLNGEVRSVLRQKLNSLHDSRTFSRYTKSTFWGSPRRSSCKLGNSRSSMQSKTSRAVEAETETSALMMDRVGTVPETSQTESV